MMEATGALAQLWSQVGGDPAALDRARLTGADPMLPTNFKIGTAASAVIGATALAAAELWRLRTGRAQSGAVDMRAAIAAFRSERYLRVDGQPPPEHRGAIFGFYRAGDGRFIQLHGAMPHHREGIVKLLGCEGTREAAAAAVAKWNAEELEDALAAQVLPAGVGFSRADWQGPPPRPAGCALPPLADIPARAAPPLPGREGGPAPARP